MGATRVRKSIKARRKQGRTFSPVECCHCGSIANANVANWKLVLDICTMAAPTRAWVLESAQRTKRTKGTDETENRMKSEVWSPKSKTLPLVVLAHHVSDVARHGAKSTFRRPIAASRRGNRGALGQRAMPSAAIWTERAGEDISDTLVAGRGNPVENADARRKRFQTSGNSG